MGELIHREAAVAPLPFVGERLTAAISGQVEIEHYHRYLLAREFCRDLDVLDVASGEGYGTALLAQVARTAVGIEIDAEVVAAARVEFRQPHLKYEQGDARNIPLPDASVDVAVSFETLEHFAEQEKFLSELRRVLRPSGLLIISTPDRDIYSSVNTPPNPYHASELTRAEFESALLQHFTFVSLASQRAIIGSVIISAARDAPVRAYEKRSDTLIEGDDNLMRAPYLIALASNAELPSLPHTIYVYRSDLDTDGKCRLAAEELCRAAETRSSESQRQLSEWREKITEWLKRDERVQVELRNAEVRIADLELKLAAVALDYHRRLERSLLEASANARSDAERLADQAKKNVHLQVEVSNLETQLLAAISRARDGQEREANASRVIASLERMIKHSEAGSRTLEAERDALNRQARELALRLTAIETSSAWRATGLLRRVGSRFPTFARAASRAAKIVWWTATLQIYHRYCIWRNRR
jgi:SAM-dependent methyltransferase